jgi:hypothetical protein
MTSTLSIGRLVRGIAVILLAGSVAACALPLPPFLAPIATASPTPTETPTPTPTAIPTPMSTLDSFKAKVTDHGFQAQGSVTGSVKVSLVLGSTSGPITGTFKVRGLDSAESITFKILGTTTTYDSIVVGYWAYERTNDGQWIRSRSSDTTLQGFVGDVTLTDEGAEPKFGRQLHHLTVADVAGVNPSAFGISAGAGQENLTLSSLSFWADDDGTPAGLSLAASLDQKILGTQSHETVTLDISIDTLSDVQITAPTN